MTPDEFRHIALSFPEATEAIHMNHPDFRVSGKIFATLGYPNTEWGMVKLTPDQQAQVVHDHPKTFIPIKGAWGRQGGTNVMLRSATRKALLKALGMAWSNIALKQLKPKRKTK